MLIGLHPKELGIGVSDIMLQYTQSTGLSALDINCRAEFWSRKLFSRFA